VRHDEAWKRLPDLLDDRDDSDLLAHVRACRACQRQLFLLGRVDRLLRDGTSVESRVQRRRTRWPLFAAAAFAAALATSVAMLAVLAPGHRTAHMFMLRTASGRLVGEAKMGNSDARNVSLALTASHMPVNRGHVFVLWAGDGTSSMQVGHFMVGQSGGCRVSFNIPATHGWRRFWVTQPGTAGLVAST
jgi:hypothetical protein